MALIDKASLLMVPSTYEAGKLYNVLPSGNRAPDSTGENSGYDQTRADFDFDRGSNTAATRVNADGLIEKYRENLLVQSNQFNTTWTDFSGASGQSGYDGLSDAWRYDSTSGSLRLQQVGITISGVKTYSIYAKYVDAQWFSLQIAGVSTEGAWFDIQNGTLGTTTNAIDSKIEPIGGGWYRCSVTGSVDNQNRVRLYVVGSDGSSTNITASLLIQNAQLESGLVSTDVLTSGATTGKAGVLIDLPRIDYSSGAGALLLEPSRQQLIQYSEYAGGSGWFIDSGYSVTHNAAISPEGVQNAFELTIPATNGNTRVVVNVSASTKYTFSFYVKRGTATDLKYSIYDFSNSSDIIASTSYYSQTSATEWKRIEVTFTTPVGCTIAGLYIDRDSQGDGTAFFYGIQLEAGSYPTSYIPNHGESGGVTRAADSCLVTGVSDVIGQTEGVVFVEAKITDGKINTSSDDLRIIELATANGSSLINIQLQDTDILRFVRVSSTQSANTIIADSALTTGGTFKMAAAYKNSDLAFYINGEQIGTSSETFTLGSVTDIFIGESRTNILQLGDSIKQVALFKERLTNEELATLTTL
jgi:hypothetical protein